MRSVAFRLQGGKCNVVEVKRSDGSWVYDDVSDVTPERVSVRFEVNGAWKRKSVPITHIRIPGGHQGVHFLPHGQGLWTQSPQGAIQSGQLGMAPGGRSAPFFTLCGWSDLFDTVFVKGPFIVECGFKQHFSEKRVCDFFYVFCFSHKVRFLDIVKLQVHALRENVFSTFAGPAPSVAPPYVV